MKRTITDQETGNTSVGRVMALDLGEKRIGVALSDENRTIARAYSVIKRSSRKADYEKIARIVSDEVVTLLVVGLPTLASGGEGGRAKWVRDYTDELSKRTFLQVELWDESYSTVDAEASLRMRGIHGKRRRRRIDAVAAAFILQSYLDEQKSFDDRRQNNPAD